MHRPTQAKSIDRTLRLRSIARLVSSHGRSVRSIQELPPEILAEILLRSMNDDEIFGLKRHPELASVCRKWRDVVISTPQLWSTITDNRQAGDPFFIVPAKLRKFKDALLTVEYRGEQKCPELDVWDLLQPTVSRWEEAALNLGWENHAKLSSTLEKGMPSLKRLTLISEGYAGDVRLGPTPRLAELCLSRNVSLDVTTGTTLSTLRRLTIISINPSSSLIINFLPTLAECPFLELLHLASITSISFNHATLFAALDVVLPFLRILKIEDADASFVSLLLRHVRADGLEQLTVRSSSEGGNMAVLRAISSPRHGNGLILPVLNWERTSSQLGLSLNEDWLRIEDETGGLFLEVGLDGRNDICNLAELLGPIYQYCAATVRNITIAVRLYHLKSFENLHVLCGAAPMVTSIHCYDRRQDGHLYRCVLDSITQNPCQACSLGGPRQLNTFSRLAEIRIHVPYAASLLPTYTRDVQMTYLSRQSIAQAAAASTAEDVLELKIYINDTYMLPDSQSLYRDPWSLISSLQFDS
ncbi:hypothetical protein FRC05_003039 [Tulasnella sp. 425]|nr:hypothetical protein FRC05_003039 [Tulasnella sp. 425]